MTNIETRVLEALREFGGDPNGASGWGWHYAGPLTPTADYWQTMSALGRLQRKGLVAHAQRGHEHLWFAEPTETWPADKIDPYPKPHSSTDLTPPKFSATLAA